MKKRCSVVFAVMLATAAPLSVAIAQTKADITIIKQGAAGKTGVDMSGMAVSGGQSAELFKRVLENDLARSGFFTIIKEGGGSLKISGSCADAGGALSVRCRVFGPIKSYMDRSYSETSAAARRLAHKVADDIVWAVKNARGIASTRIAMVGNVGGRKDIYVCDADGANLVRITNDGTPCLTPRWSPDGNSIVYTSMRNGFPDVYLIDMRTYERRRISDFPGLNSGAVFSPDGGTLALVLSKDGNPELYTMSLRGGRITRITRTPRVAEASPSWSPDGGRIVFVSNATGLPQLYMSDRTGNAKRIPLVGSENVSPDWGPAGIAFCSRREGRYTICVLDPNTGRDEQITMDLSDHEDPSWAPDGRHIACTRTQGHHSDIYILDTQKDPPIRLTTAQGEWYCPSWSPR